MDLLNLGKGFAWVDGQSLGHYWPSCNADEDGYYAEPCDYCGEYSNKKMCFQLWETNLKRVG